MKALAVDVGGTTIKAAVVRADGTLSTVATAPTPRGADATVAAVAALLATFPATVSGPVGVVVPGIVDETRGVGVLSANIGWYDAPLRDLLTDALGREVVLGHDVRSGALAEARWGAGGHQFLYVPVGTGISLAHVVDGAAQGDAWAGEIGQVMISRGAEPVTLESVASAAGVGARGSAALGRPLSAVEVMAAVDTDPRARDVVADAVRTLAEALATACAATGAFRVVVGGGLAAAGEAYLHPLERALAARFHPALPRPTVVAATLGTHSQLLGAGLLALRAEGGLA